MNRELNDKIEKFVNKTKSEFISRKTLYNGKFIKLIEENYIMPDGKDLRRERIVKNKGKKQLLL